MSDFPILTVLLFLPMAGAAVVSMLPSEADRAIRALTLFFSVVVFAISLVVVARFDPAVGEFQFVEFSKWVPSAGAVYRIGVDGISLWMVVLTAFLTPISVLASWNVDRRVKTFHAVILVLETGMLGVFLALDLILFYVFWEGMLIPMYFLIGIWGYERRVYAAVKFFIYTLAGSLLMLAGILALYFIGEPRSFDLERLLTKEIAASTQLWLYGAFFASFAIKVPIFPFHTWLPDAHTEAPTAGSVLLAGVLLKMGAYGFLRFSIPLFPDATAELSGWLALLGVIGIVYGGIVSAVQRDIKRLVAYSSVSHLGFVILGIAALSSTSASGSVLQMVNHGLSTGALFLLVGMLYERAHTRQIADLSGLGSLMPVLSGAFLLVALSSLGLPGLNGFVGEFVILIGSFPVYRVLTAVGAFGVVLAAVYLLWAYERVFTGAPRGPHIERRSLWRDLSPREIVVLAPLLVTIVAIGVFPQPLLERIQPSIDKTLSKVGSTKIAER